jgi:transketolase
LLSRHELANAIRVLSMDAVQKANSGHPGAPMGMADIAEVLWNDYLIHNPGNPTWFNRDRFIMSNGHGSMLLYSLLHLSGYDVSMEDIRAFRQLHSKTPGHPEYGYTPGIETTTGPLGQGVANAVGMAIAEKVLASQFNQNEYDIVDHFTYVTVGDGCLMEGISHEACSLAGTLKLGKLIAIYDSNNISIDGEIQGWFTEDIEKRFESYQWHVINNVDGHNPDEISAALKKAKDKPDQPSLIIYRTIIGWGSPNKQGKESSHGSALGVDEVELVRKNLKWTHDPFVMPDEYYDGWDARKKGSEYESKWQSMFDAYTKEYPSLANEFQRRMEGHLPSDWDQTVSQYIKSCVEKTESIASRKASQNSLNAYGPILPELIGGSADLAASNLTIWSGSKALSGDSADGNYIYYGVREFAMCAINNGIALHGGFIPYGSTFLIFSEYARNALRMAALMKQRNIFVFTHDSIGLGEDGPTHQAVEQTATLRMIPNMSTWRPCDTVETAVAWTVAIENQTGPTSLLFSRQNLAHIERSEVAISNIYKGAYIIFGDEKIPDVIIIATGSEVQMALDAARQYENKDINVRVVSMPCTDAFDKQDEAYKNSVLPLECRKRIAVEAGIPDYWRKYVGLDGLILGVPTFGESAPADQVYKHFGITTENLVGLIEKIA